MGQPFHPYPKGDGGGIHSPSYPGIVSRIQPIQAYHLSKGGGGSIPWAGLGMGGGCDGGWIPGLDGGGVMAWMGGGSLGREVEDEVLDGP